ncbi:MAG: response regulator [Nitrospirota bacterium]
MTDDEPALLNAIAKQLTQAQHRVPGFKSGDELLAAVDQRELDQALPDIKIPGKTGLETLAICENIIEAHYGDIYLASKVGVGTTVSRWLPLSQAPQPAPR